MTTSGPQWHLNRPDLLVAGVGWGAVLPALRQTSGEAFEVVGPPLPGNWWDWQYSGKQGDAWPLLAGDHDGHSYVLTDSIGLAMAADRVPLLAAHLETTVLGYTYEDTAGTEMLTAARGPDLLRYTLRSNWGDHEEGEPLPGEAEGIEIVLRNLGFDPDAWLEHGTTLRLRWTPLEPDIEAEAHRRLYAGPLRMRVDHIEQAAREEFEGEAEDS